jgi:ABC-2 type transport system ATP-binding protein
MKLSIDIEKVRASEIIGLLSNQLDIVDVSVENRPIEEIILSLYNKFEI